MPASPTSAIAAELGNPLMQGPMTAEETEKLRKKQEAMDKFLADEGKGKYKIELMLGRDRSMMRPIAGLLSFWESGTKLHGGGDTAMHICPGRSLKRNDCEAFIPDQSHGLGFLICPKCFTRWEGEQVFGQLAAKLTYQGWADKLVRYYQVLEHSADLVLKYYPGSLRSASILEQGAQRMGEEFGKVRGKRHKLVYPQAHIIKDTSNGADLHAQVLRFLKS